MKTHMHFLLLISTIVMMQWPLSSMAQPASAPTSPGETPAVETSSTVPDVDELKRQVQTLTNEVQDLRNHNVGLTKERAQATAQLRELRSQLDQSGLSLPTNIQFQDRFVTDRHAAFRFQTDRIGRLVARLSENGNLIAEKRSEYGTLHTFRFDVVVPGRGYRLEVAAINAAGNASNIRLANVPDLEFTAPPVNQSPTITISPIASNLTSNSIRITYTVSEPAFVEFECRQRIPGTIDFKPCGIASRGTAEVSELGRPVGASVPAGSNTVAFDGLTPDNEYVFDPSGFDIMAAPLTINGPQPVFTTKKRLDFDGPIHMEVTPLGITVRWKPTTPADKAAVRLHFEGNSLYQTNPPLQAGSGYYETTIPVAALSTLLFPNKTTLPVVETSMVGDGAEQVRSFVVGIKVPDPNAPGLTPQQRAAIRDVASAVGRPTRGRISWDEIVQLGLPLVLSFL